MWQRLQERSGMIEEESSVPSLLGGKNDELETWWPRFRSEDLEQAFVESDAQRLNERQGLTAGILFHLCFCVWQWQVVVNPDHGSSYFLHHGNPDLKMKISMTETLHHPVGCLTFTGLCRLHSGRRLPDVEGGR